MGGRGGVNRFGPAALANARAQAPVGAQCVAATAVSRRRAYGDGTSHFCTPLATVRQPVEVSAFAWISAATASRLRSWPVVTSQVCTPLAFVRQPSSAANAPGAQKARAMAAALRRRGVF